MKYAILNLIEDLEDLEDYIYLESYTEEQVIDYANRFVDTKQLTEFSKAVYLLASNEHRVLTII